MTIGNRIQQLRKNLGLSQEELGQRLLVSRQTVSQWETDQTIPTIDNLIRLREIFGVSVDEILCGSETGAAGQEDADVPVPPMDAPEPEPQPSEFYRFTYDRDGLKPFRRTLIGSIVKRMVIFLIAVCFLITVFAASGVDVLTWITMGILLLGMLQYVRLLIRSSKEWNEAQQRICRAVYEYRVYGDARMDGKVLDVRVFRGEEKEQHSRYTLGDIREIKDCGDLLAVNLSGLTYLLKKGELAPESVFLRFFNMGLEAGQYKRRADRWIVLSRCLFVLSILSLWLALAVSAILGGDSLREGNMKSFFAFWAFLPIPIASIVLGFRLKKAGYKYKKNLVAGFIIAPLLLIYGSFPLAFSDLPSLDAPLKKLEQALSVDLPTPTGSRIQTGSSGSGEKCRYICDLTFNIDGAKRMESLLDSRWLPELPDDLAAIAPSPVDGLDFDAVLIWNTDTGVFNTPTESGVGSFLYAAYDRSEGRLIIIEYIRTSAPAQAVEKVHPAYGGVDLFDLP